MQIFSLKTNKVHESFQREVVTIMIAAIIIRFLISDSQPEFESTPWVSYFRSFSSPRCLLCRDGTFLVFITIQKPLILWLERSAFHFNPFMILTSAKWMQAWEKWFEPEKHDCICTHTAHVCGNVEDILWLIKVLLLLVGAMHPL